MHFNLKTYFSIASPISNWQVKSSLTLCSFSSPPIVSDKGMTKYSIVETLSWNDNNYNHNTRKLVFSNLKQPFKTNKFISAWHFLSRIILAFI